jgi:3'-phosphoadenosine 5'-phosphosulfate sulfotransferase (PAPS reductase)/FAD synthetase
MMHAKTDRHRRRVDLAKSYLDKFFESSSRPYLAFSGGKDSCAMLALAVDHGYRGRVMWLSGDLDYPSEDEHVQQWAKLMGLEIDVVRTPGSTIEMLRAQAHEILLDEDNKLRNDPVNAVQFFAPIEAYKRQYDCDGVLLGLRKEESKGRHANRAVRGVVYYVKNRHEWVGQPICDWQGIDVYAYVLSRGLPLFDVYRCVRYHESPDRVRMDGWYPGAHATRGATIWLKTYYPSLFRKLCSILSDAASAA